MKTKFNTIRNDLYNVLVEGNGNRQQMARVFFLLFIPLFTLYFSFGHLKFI
ncbi:hypothetical protein IM792_07735 [Mucilaginibacter sp. JRF]|uniref:hypothetical protein n=1 Tax=Mucilaginibacter sp. JRF TaxID=2780088 RepID=UPI00188002AF|nr:hypothetical protein [Mucilaginibacter sp. JRF]MBE9584334.1 hypothetical protein [Mucilaginibacter sp. JRF]